MKPASTPLVTAVFAQSLDGRIALCRENTGARSGRAPERTVFSTEEGSIHAHRARAAHDAVLVGIGTLLADDPRLTVRLCASSRFAPMRVVVDSAFATPVDARLVAGGDAGRVVVIGAEGRADPSRRAALDALGVDTCTVPASSDGRVDLALALTALAARGVARLLVEGGSAILTSFFRARLVDAVEIEVAAVFVGNSGIPALGALDDGVDLRSLAGAVRLDDVTVDRLGANLLVRGRVVYGSHAP